MNGLASVLRVMDKSEEADALLKRYEPISLRGIQPNGELGLTPRGHA